MIYATTDFFISSVAEDLVLATIDTGFRPSVDGFKPITSLPTGKMVECVQEWLTVHFIITSLKSHR